MRLNPTKSDEIVDLSQVAQTYFNENLQKTNKFSHKADLSVGLKSIYCFICVHMVKVFCCSDVNRFSHRNSKRVASSIVSKMKIPACNDVAISGE